MSGEGGDVPEGAAGTALAVVSKASLPELIKADTTDILGQLAAKVAAFKPDVSTPKGRDAMRSLAHEIKLSKGKLDRLGLGLTEDWRAKTSQVNGERKVLATKLDDLAERVRAPLTAFENADKARVQAHEAALAEMETLGKQARDLWQTTPLAMLTAQLAKVEALARDRDWEEFAQRASDARADAMDRCTAAIGRRERADLAAEEAERAKLAAQAEAEAEAARRQVEREAQIAAEAAASAARAVEEAAALEAERVAAEEAAARAALEAEREREQRAREVAEANARQAELDRVAAVEAKAEALRQAERDRLAEADRVREAGLRAEAEAARRAEAARVAAEEAAAQRERDAIEAERARVAAETERQRVEAERREKDKAHKAKVHRAIMAGMILAGVTEEQGKAVITAIARGQVPHVTIAY